jgi:hypothetical protein
MSTADALREDASSAREGAGKEPTAPSLPQTNGAGPAPEAPRKVPRPSPIASAAWLLQATAVGAAVSGALSLVVAPGVRGNASETVVVWADRAAGSAAFFLLLLLAVLAGWGAVELLRPKATGGGRALRVVQVVCGGVVVALSSPALRDRVPPLYAAVIATGAAATALAGAYFAAGAPHTRAVAALLALFVVAALVRLTAWWLALYAGETASVRLFTTSRGLATAGVLFEAAGQLIAFLWLSTRGRGGAVGQLGAFAALVGGLVVTSGVARGVHSGAALWQAIVHTALADAPGVPPPYGLDALATFLVPVALLLALILALTAFDSKQSVGVLVPMALALVSRGAFDAPLRALCVVVAAFWVVLARTDEQAMWRSLLREREARREELTVPRPP